VVTHDVQEALLLADHVIVMNSFGGIETRKEIKSDYSIMQSGKQHFGIYE
jgi:ABC-type nitrate/sulfonate/bicarbonate transport system ATPase subunit